MDRTSDFGSDSEGSNPSAVTFAPLSGLFYCLKFRQIISENLFTD